MIHIVFNEPDTGLMKQVMELDNALSGAVIQIKDDFAVGPLAGIDTEEGWEARANWWKQLLTDSPYGEKLAGSFDDRTTVKEIKEKLYDNPDEEAWIWMAQNQHDVCGYYWLIPQLSEFRGRIMVLYLNNLPFISEKGHLFYPSWLQEIQPKEFLKAKKLSRPVTDSEFEVDGDEWKRICEENAEVRILEGGKKLAGKEADFFDKDIRTHLTTEWQKASRFLHNTLHRMRIKTGDVFMMWRLKNLISLGEIEVMGDPRAGWKEFDVRKAGTKAETNEVQEVIQAGENRYDH